MEPLMLMFQWYNLDPAHLCILRRTREPELIIVSFGVREYTSCMPTRIRPPRVLSGSIRRHRVSLGDGHYRPEIKLATENRLISSI
jgi:hypothetical protein